MDSKSGYGPGGKGSNPFRITKFGPIVQWIE